MKNLNVSVGSKKKIIKNEFYTMSLFILTKCLQKSKEKNNTHKVNTKYRYVWNTAKETLGAV